MALHGDYAGERSATYYPLRGARAPFEVIRAGGLALRERRTRVRKFCEGSSGSIARGILRIGFCGAREEKELSALFCSGVVVAAFRARLFGRYYHGGLFLLFWRFGRWRFGVLEEGCAWRGRSGVRMF